MLHERESLYTPPPPPASPLPPKHTHNTDPPQPTSRPPTASNACPCVPVLQGITRRYCVLNGMPACTCPVGSTCTGGTAGNTWCEVRLLFLFIRALQSRVVYQWTNHAQMKTVLATGLWDTQHMKQMGFLLLTKFPTCYLQEPIA